MRYSGRKPFPRGEQTNDRTDGTSGRPDTVHSRDRGMVDTDLAEVYGVQTKRLNEQVKRNVERFPEDFAFRLTPEEKMELVAKCDRFSRLKHSTAFPPKIPRRIGY